MTRDVQEFNSWLATMVVKKAVEAHCAKSWPTPNAPMIDGIDTLTMVDDRTIVIDPIIPQAVTNHR